MGNILASFLSWLFNWQDTVIISEEDVLKQLQSSHTFSWCIYRKRDIIRHVGFVLIFDEEPFCTVDFTVENPSAPCLVGCPSKVLIQRVPTDFEDGVERGKDIQRLETQGDYCRQRAEKIIRKLVTPNQENYSLLFHNCRHNTREVVNQVCDSGLCGENVEDARQMLLRTEREDKLIVLSIISQLAAALDIMLSLALKRLLTT